MGSHQHRGCPLGKKKRPNHRERQELPSPSPVRPALAENLQETDSEDNYGEDERDPHASTKPSPLDGEALDECWDPEDDTEDVEGEALNIGMVNMISKLQDDDWHDWEWKPKQVQKKKQGQSCHDPDIRYPSDTYLFILPLSFPFCHVLACSSPDCL